jgi:hypothetical protein
MGHELFVKAAKPLLLYIDNPNTTLDYQAVTNCGSHFSIYSSRDKTKALN